MFLLLFTYSMQAQDKVIEGTIIDEAGQPLPGASVIVKGTSNGVSSDFDGNYLISNVNENDILLISFLGYNTQEINVSGKKTINITLIADNSVLDEVVVVGYGSQRKSDLSGAVTSLKEEEFAPGVIYDAVQLLSGTVAGVNVSQVNSAPGSSFKVQIRGAGSINSSNNVLYVVDGLPGVDTKNISPNDIESIEVLKDASAASIYGTRAANGVVLITTKKGKPGKSTLSFNSYVANQDVSKKTDVLGATDYMGLINFRSTSAGNEPVYTDEEISNAGSGTNWQDEIFTSALVQNYELSMSGGNETGNYYIGLNYFSQDGVVESSFFDKYNMRMNARTKPINNLSISTNLNVTNVKSGKILYSNGVNEFAGPINSSIQYDPTILPGLDDNGDYFRNPIIALDNPQALIDGYSNEISRTTIYGSISADYEFVKNVTATLRVGADINNSRSDTYRDQKSLIGAGHGGIGDIYSSEEIHWLAETLVKYENTFKEKHKLKVMGGTTWEHFSARGVSAHSENFLSDVTGTNLLQSGDSDQSDAVSSFKSTNTLNGFIGRVNYGFNNKYLFTASVRVDGSSKFSTENKYAVFPSASVAWRIKDESFLENTDWLSSLKLRIGYGTVGNQGIPNYATLNTLVVGGTSVFDDKVEQGVVPARLPNPDLTWEVTEEINFGVDYGFLNNALSGSIDIFKRKTKDQLFNKPLPSAIGFTNVLVNLGEVENSGVEFLINAKIISNDDFNWHASGTLAYLKNEVTQLPDFIEQIVTGGAGFIGGISLVREGEALRSFYGYEIDGIFQEGDDIANSPTPAEGYQPGMPKFVDQNGDGTINADDRTILGDPFPDFTFGINNSLSYKRFNFDFFIMGVQGIETMDGNIGESLYPSNSARNSISKYYLNRWTPENPSNELPSGENPSLYGGALAVNTLTVVDASFVRLKNISLGYSIPISKKSGLSLFKVYLSGDNLVTITDFEGFDPDASNNQEGVSKVNYNSYPLPKTIRLGINVKF